MIPAKNAFDLSIAAKIIRMIVCQTDGSKAGVFQSQRGARGESKYEFIFQIVPFREIVLMDRRDRSFEIGYRYIGDMKNADQCLRTVNHTHTFRPKPDFRDRALYRRQ